LLVVNTNDIDFVERHTDLQELLRRVSEAIRGTQYFLPLGSTGAVGAETGKTENAGRCGVCPRFQFRTTTSCCARLILRGRHHRRVAQHYAHISRSVELDRCAPVDVAQGYRALITAGEVAELFLIAPVLVRAEDRSIGQSKERHAGRPNLT